MIVSGFSGNELYCLAKKGFAPGSIVVGNSVQSLGVVGGLSSGLRTIAGGEISNLTRLITEGSSASRSSSTRSAAALSRSWRLAPRLRKWPA